MKVGFYVEGEDNQIDKDPGEKLVYTIDWNADGWLGVDAIATSVFTAETGIAIDAQSDVSPQAFVKLSGGTLGKSYRVTNTITTVTGLETGVRSFVVNLVRR